MKEVTIYTDGACSGNPGEGGWCAILMYKQREKVVSGYNKYTTNNRMELFAVIQGLNQLKEPCIVNLYSDSAYVVNAITQGWLDALQKKMWRTGSGEVKNIDLWKILQIKLEQHDVRFIKVKGHADNEYNNRCDKIAREEIKKAQSGN